MRRFMCNTGFSGKMGLCIAGVFISAAASVCLNRVYIHFFSDFGADRLSPERISIFFVQSKPYLFQ